MTGVADLLVALVVRESSMHQRARLWHGALRQRVLVCLDGAELGHIISTGRCPLFLAVTVLVVLGDLTAEAVRPTYLALVLCQVQIAPSVLSFAPFVVGDGPDVALLVDDQAVVSHIIDLTVRLEVNWFDLVVAFLTVSF
jgi:hypothetical protein